MSRGVGELVLLIISTMDCDEDTQVMSAWCNANARPRKFCTQLIESPSRYALDRAVDVEGGDRRVVRGLLGEI